MLYGAGVITFCKDKHKIVKFYCELCGGTYLNSEMDLHLHTEGSRHKITKTERHPPQSIQDTPFERAWLDKTYGKGFIAVVPMPMNPKRNIYFCRLCLAEANTRKVLYAHCHGSKHRMKLLNTELHVMDKSSNPKVSEGPEKTKVPEKIKVMQSTRYLKNKQKKKLAAIQQSSSGGGKGSPEKQQLDKVEHDVQLRKRKSADTKLPQKHPRRNHGLLGSTARHQNQPPFSPPPFSTPANDTDIPQLLQSSYFTSSTSAASLGLPFYLSPNTSLDYLDTIPFEHHPDRDFYHHPGRDFFDRHPDTNSFDHHPASKAFDHHPDKISFVHHSDLMSFSHQDTNSCTFANSPDPPCPLPTPLPPPRPCSEHARACDVKAYLLRKVECCQLHEGDIGGTTNLVMKLMTAVEDFCIHNLDLKSIRQAKQTLDEAGMQFGRLKLLLNQQASTRNFSNIL